MIGTVSIATRVKLRRSTVMRRAATRRTYNTSERAVARRAERVSKDIATSVVDSDTRSGIGFGKDGGYGKGYGKDKYAGKAYGKGKGGDGKGGMRKACFGCGSTEHVIKNCPKNTNVQQVEEDV